jgi:hypothetical protein
MPDAQYRHFRAGDDAVNRVVAPNRPERDVDIDPERDFGPENSAVSMARRALLSYPAYTYVSYRTEHRFTGRLLPVVGIRA